MRRLPWVMAAAVLWSGGASGDDEPPPGRVPGSQQADVHNPFSPGYRPLLPNPGGPRPSTPAPSPSGPRPEPAEGVIVVPVVPVWPGWSWRSDPWWAYDQGPYVLPWVWQDAGALYGPTAARRFLQGPPAEGGPAPRSQRARVARVSERATNAQSRARGLTFLGYGDAHFGKRKYQDALQRYRLAAEAAPELADAPLRQALALVALESYPAAAKAVRRALALQADWSESPLRLERLYGGDRAARAAHQEALAAAIEARPEDADLFLLLGVHLYFDAQRERAAVFLRRAAQLGANADGALGALLRTGAGGRAEF